MARSPGLGTCWEVVILIAFHEFLPALVGSVLAGGLIGFEREWRGRAAGLRTHILVSLASALLMLAAVSQDEWALTVLPNKNIVTDPTRMAHGILTGIGFLCAGVIFRNGFSVKGLTTAASLWVTSAIGILFGAGLLLLGTIGTGLTLAILVGLRLLSRRLPTEDVIDITASWRRDEVSPLEDIQARLRAEDPGFVPGAMAVDEGGSRVSQTFRVKVAGPERSQALFDGLKADPRLTGVTVTPRGE